MSDEALALLRGAYFGTLIGGYLFFIQWESGRAHRPFADAASRRRHVLRNLGLFVLVVLLADLAFGIGLLNTTSMIQSVPDGLLTRFDLSWPVQLVIGVVAIDLLYYGWHRLSHAVPLLWRMHRVHHSDTHLDVTTATRFHPLEVCVSIALVVSVLLALGIPLWVELARTLIINPLIMAQHANVRFPQSWDRALCGWLVTPALHRVHHSPLREEHDSNYGQIFSLWDRWFGTLRTGPASVAEVGVRGLDAERWQSVAGMMLTPFARPEAPRGLEDAASR